MSSLFEKEARGGADGATQTDLIRGALALLLPALGSRPQSLLLVHSAQALQFCYFFRSSLLYEAPSIK